MLATHLYFKGQCREAIDLYVKVFKAVVKIIIPKPGREELVVHAEVIIDNHLLMFNDFGDNNGCGYDLSYRFDNEDELKKAYSIMKDGSTTIAGMQTTDYSACVVRFVDRFGVRWAFWI